MMIRILIRIYALAAVAMALITVINQTQPALFIMKMFAKLLHNKFPVALVLVITMLIYLSPLLIFAFIAHLIRGKTASKIDPNGTGIFITRKKTLSNGMWSVPVYLNDEKVGKSTMEKPFS